MLFELGVLLSATCLLVWMSWVKKIILGSVLIGLVLRWLHPSSDRSSTRGRPFFVGIGLVCAEAAGMVGKEACCFGYREGWLLMMIGLPVVVLENLIGRENRIFNSLGFSFLFLLLLSLTGKKLKQRLPSSYTANVRGVPSLNKN